MLPLTQIVDTCMCTSVTIKGSKIINLLWYSKSKVNHFKVHTNDNITRENTFIFFVEYDNPNMLHSSSALKIFKLILVINNWIVCFDYQAMNMSIYLVTIQIAK